MKFKEIFIIICLTMCIFTISGVCAGDVDDIAVLSDENSNDLNVYAQSLSSDVADENSPLEVSSDVENNVSLIDNGERLTENKKNTNLDASDLTTYYDSEDYLIVTLKDSDKYAIEGATLTVSLDGTRNYVTDDFGQIKVPTKNLNAKTYTADINFAGDDKYIESSKTVKITVSKTDSILALQDNYSFNYGTVSSIVPAFEGCRGVLAKIDDMNIDVKENNIVISGLNSGSHLMTVTTVPDENHYAVSKNVTITINKADSMIALKDVNLDYGNSFKMVINGNGLTGITAQIDGKDAEVDGNIITIHKLDAGKHTLTVTSIPDANHKAVSKNATVTVNKVDSLIAVNDVDVDYGSSAMVDVNSEGATGIKAEIDGNRVDVNGNTISIPKLDIGLHMMTVTSIPDANHNAVTKTAKINVTKARSKITASNAKANVGEKTNLTVTVTSFDSVNDGVVSFFLDETEIGQAKVKKGLASLMYTPQKAEILSFSVVYSGTSIYLPSSSTFNLKVLDNSTNPSDDAADGKSKMVVVPALNYDLDDFYVEITMPDDAKGALTITIGGEDYPMKIENGVARVKLPDWDDGDCPFTLTYSGDSIYSSFKDNGVFKVNRTQMNQQKNSTQQSEVKVNPTIPSLNDVSGDVIRFNFPADAAGTITLTINGKNYNFDVVNGKADVKLPELANGDYPYTIKYSGDGKYSSFASTDSLKVNKTAKPQNTTVIDNSKVAASNLKVTYLADKYYSIKVYGSDGKLLNGVNVAITLNGKTFKSLTSKDGVVKFKVTQKPGKYQLKITALGKTVKKTLTVNHLVKLSSVSVKKSAKKLVLKATLGKINGKYLKKKTVTFKFNGKTYKAKTNSKGVAKATVSSSVLKKLKVGKKISYQASYGKDTVKKTVKVKK